MPGLVIQIAIFGTAFGGFGLIAELRSGVIERMRVTPMSRVAMLLGRSLRDVVILMFQAILLIVLAIPLGLDVDPAGVAVVLGLLVLIGLVTAPLSYSAALILKSEDAFAPLVNSVAMPLLLLSGILLPMALAPDWLQFLSSLSPLSHAVDAARSLFNGQWGDPEILIGVGMTGDPGGPVADAGGTHFQPRQRLSHVSRRTRSPGPLRGSGLHPVRVSGRSGEPRRACRAGARRPTTCRRPRPATAT